MNPPVTCYCCGREIGDWTPYRVQDRLYITFRHCGLAHMIEARFELAGAV